MRHGREPIESVEEVRTAPRRRDGSLRDDVTVWAVRYDDGVYIRPAVKGRDAAWYRAVEATHQGLIVAGRLQKDVSFDDLDDSMDGDINAAYRTKYSRYAGPILNSCLTDEARSTTVKAVPVSHRS